METIPKRVLVFGAHSDDEIVGLGGTIAKFSKQGSSIYLVTFTKGETGYSKIEQKDKIASIREKEAQKSSKILGIKKVINLGIPTQTTTNTREVYQECVRLIRLFKPNVIFTNYYEDKHRDHRAVSEITDGARWKATENMHPELGSPWYTPHLFYYELQEPFTHPSLLIDITKTLPKKIQAMKTHKSQMIAFPRILDFIEGLAKARGFLCETRYAEAFLKSNLIPQRMK